MNMQEYYNKLRRKAKLTNQKIARELRVTTVTLKSYVQEPGEMRIKHFNRLCALLKVDPGEMLTTVNLLERRKQETEAELKQIQASREKAKRFND